ncbi:tetratricopeptide repeat protein [Alkalimonas amylolytica]|uniref:Tetratricopeptide repeat-containing protein n=1 Tax=Alkalimonas amylolytica TaxID=152573 RepID=A0A1H4BHD5_ALKAM|nr:hypothetical protein [Alkalimonas amylolytica]SEA47573.1 hypothetical protein SAMN04488051_103364 [Alkalimonas amylolytica]
MRLFIVFLCCALSSVSYAFEPLDGKFSQDPGVVLFESYQYDDAERYFKDHLSGQGDLYELSLLYLAKLSVLRNDGKKAVDFIEKSLAIEPNGVDEMILAGDAYCIRAMQVSMFRALRLGRACGQWYTRAADEHPENIQALRTAIQFHLDAPSIAGGSMNKARAFLDKLTDVSEEDARIINVLFVQENDSDQQAMALANSFASMPYTNPRTAYDLASFFKRQNNVDKALELFSQVIAERSDDVENWHVTDAYFQLGDLLITTGTNLKEGIALIEQYIATSHDEYDDHYFWSRLRLAKAYKEMGNDLEYEELLALIQSKDYSHDSGFKKAFDDHLKH